jgi:hypothetical protein
MHKSYRKGGSAMEILPGEVDAVEFRLDGDVELEGVAVDVAIADVE